MSEKNVGKKPKIKAAPADNTDYPGIKVTVDGVTAAVVEYDRESNKVLVRVYTKDNDEPNHVVDFIKY